MKKKKYPQFKSWIKEYPIQHLSERGIRMEKRNVTLETGVISFRDEMTAATKVKRAVMDSDRYSPMEEVPLATLLMRYEARSNKLPNQIYLDSVIVNRQSYSNIINGRTVCPTRDTLLALGIGLELSFEDMKQFMYSCGYSFPGNIRESYVAAFIDKIGYLPKDTTKTTARTYAAGKDLMKLDDVLCEYGFMPFVGGSVKA